MSHFEITEWADFATGVLGTDRTAILERHLAGGLRGMRRDLPFAAERRFRCGGRPALPSPSESRRGSRGDFSKPSRKTCLVVVTNRSSSHL